MSTARDIFKENLDRIMHDKRITQTQISDGTGIPLSTISSWCLGQSYPRVDKMQTLADYLNVSMRELTDKAQYTDKTMDMIGRAAEAMTNEEKERMLAILKAAFSDKF